MNSFEQLCINYANEKLQQVFFHHVFELEKLLYNEEGIEWKGLGFAFNDNRAVIELLEKKGQSPGIFPFLDEAVALPRATDVTVFARLQKVHEGHAHFRNAPKVKGQKAKQIEMRARSTLSFVVLHSAAPDVGVQYYVRGFVEKNRDTLAVNMESAIKASSLTMLQEAYALKAKTKSKVHTHSWNIPGTLSLSFFCAFAHFPISSFFRSFPRPLSSFLLLHKTVGGKFISDMRSLKKALTSTEPHFIRCVKPNNAKAARLFSPPLVHHQLQYLGVLSSIEIRHSGFSYRVDFDTFYRQFAMLAGSFLPYPAPEGADMRRLCTELLAILSDMVMAQDGTPITEAHAQIGRTRIFFRNFMINSLETLREEHYRLMDAAAIAMQAWWEQCRNTNKFAKMRTAFTHLQAAARAKLYRDAWVQHRSAVATIQRNATRFLRKRDALRCEGAALIMQDAGRSWLLRKSYRNARRGVLALRLAARSVIARRHVLRVWAAVCTLQRTMRAWLVHFRNYWDKVRLCLLLQGAVRARQWRRSEDGAEIYAALAVKRSARKRVQLIRIMEDAWKTMLVQKRLNKMRDAARVLQFWRRTIILRARFIGLRDTLRMLQRVARGALARKEATKRVAAITDRRTRWRIKTVREREALQLTRSNRQPMKRDLLSVKKIWKLIDVDVVSDVSDVFPEGWTRVALELKRAAEKQGKYIASIACGASHAAAVTNTGDLYTWGLGDRGQLGHGSTEGEPRARMVEALFYGAARKGPGQGAFARARVPSCRRPAPPFRPSILTPLPPSPQSSL